MKIKITMSLDDIKEAMRMWMDAKGVPVIAADSFVVQKKNYNNGYDSASHDDLRVVVEFEADSYSSGSK